jgi:hypothetical protein
MTALPADVAKYTSDGVVITSEDLALKLAHPEAEDRGTDEIEMFFVDPAHAQILLNEKLILVSNPSPIHEGVEVEESLGIGTTIGLAPVVPNFRFIDETRGIDVVARTRGIAYETGSDRYSVELLE